ncbi:MAG: hypothetical protein SXG53_15870 [Pseudomonadota bacterium]|nr:hypothetical protein [Pseudomonadota bacterium]
MRIESAPLLAFACLLAALAPLAVPAPAPVEVAGFPGWPGTFNGQTLQPVALSLLERRFAETFPGRIGRFSDGRQQVILRWIAAPTRKLHAASDCFKGSGYRVKPLPLATTDGLTWGSFAAQRGTQRLLVREVITDGNGSRWTDVSAWYWAAVRGETQAPWWAITVAAADSGLATESTMPLTGAE